VDKKSSALDRARADLAAGRPDLARERLHGYLHSLHCRGDYNQDAYLLLGEVLFAMKDYARAGAAWLLTERDDAEAQVSIDAFHKRFGTDPVNVLRALKPRARSEEYPPKVQERLQNWGYRYMPYRARSNPHETMRPDEEPERTLRPIEAGCIVMLIGGAVLSLIYFYMRLHGR